jgi:rifampicin phosphotransferase
MLDTDLPFTPPSPGCWELEATHLSRPITRWGTAVFPDAFSSGFRYSTSRYGLLLDYLEPAIINGFEYVCARPVGAPKSAKSHPPRLIFKLLTWLHPEIRRRIRRSALVFEQKLWRDDLAEWDRELKPAIARENEAMQRVDPRRLDDAALAQHLERCRDLVHRGVFRHHALNIPACLPLGDFLVHAARWTGLSVSDLLPLFRGSSRVSRGAADELDQLVVQLRKDEGLLTLLAGSEPAAILEALTTAPGEAGAAARRYVDKVGVRVATGYDVADLTLSEMPELLLETIRSAATASAELEHSTAALDAQIRQLVPSEHRTFFDELLVEARATYRLRDERGYLNDAWSTGIARHALLAAGERLAVRGQIEEPLHALDLTPDELQSLLSGGSGPDPAEVARFAAYRTTKTVKDAPPLLGFPPSPPPPAEWLPAPAARAARAIDLVLGEMFAARKVEEKGEVSGFGASPGVYEGVARLVLDPKDMGRVGRGEILVTRATSPSYNALLPLISGVVTDRGGTLSHAALVAREYGLPAVVGCGNASVSIPDGARIRIDGTRGTVEILR